MAQATEQDLLAARIAFRAVFPVIKVLLEDDAKFAKRFEGVDATVQFAAKNEPENVAAHMRFHDGTIDIVPEPTDAADITFAFSSVAKMNAMFAGKPVLPHIKGLTKVGLLVKVFSVLLALKLLQPEAKPKDAEQARLKVKMTLYMITTALSQLNKAGDPDMVKWTTKQPERIYQWSCEPEGIAAYLRVKAGKSKAGRGYYTRRKPFVHMKFDGVDNALPVLGNRVDMVQAIGKGQVTIDGSPEYGAAIGNFMVRIAALLS
ncbi:MAG TPA: hypothetical protein PLO37_14585 [Candidatus Hydrogenedentes bacterium]|nr:hypothetical protein [Candidatus Hydrogenedentota bacterium]HPG68074.1 hypothetical protein [Candidatus Hydrogenedentota bacterium]